MHQFLTTDDFICKGQSIPDMPLLIDDEGQPVLIANRFLMYLKLEKGRVHSPKTLVNYSNSLYDYFSFLEAQALEWNEPPRRTDFGKEVSNLSLYQRWCHETYHKDNGDKLKHSTINTRIGHIESFYLWVKETAGLVDWLPFVQIQKIIYRREHPDAMAHMHAGIRVVESSENRLPIKKEPLKILTLEECWYLRAAPITGTLRNATWLMLGIGIRNEECRTFPRKYIFDPANLDRNKRIRIYLDARDMKTKGDKSRYVFVSWALMNALYQYTKFGEGAVRAKLYEEKFGSPPLFLFLNDRGDPYSDKGLNNAYRKLCKGYEKNGEFIPPVLSFAVHPHKLRHTFATMELYYEAEKLDKHGNRKGLGHALKWVQKRLGHSSLQSVLIYIHCLELLDSSELNDYQQELDRMMLEGVNAA
jgi:site-specific recombinase XerD